MLTLLFAFVPTVLSAGSNGEFVFILLIELKLGMYCVIYSRFPASFSAPASHGSLWAPGLCITTSQAQLFEHLSFLSHIGRLKLLSPNRCGDYIFEIFILSGVCAVLSRVPLTISVNLLVKNFNVRCLPLSSLALILSMSSQDELCPLVLPPWALAVHN